MLETLNTPVPAHMLADFEREMGATLPPAVRESMLAVDGQDALGGVGLSDEGLFFGLHLLTLEDVIREWTFWRSVEHDPSSGANAQLLLTMASIPPDWIKHQYACRGWVPLISDRAGNYVGVDLDPGQSGSYGQVILFGRDFDRKCVLWRGEGTGGWGKWLASFADELESGQGWEVEGMGSPTAGGGRNSDDSEDDVGYSGYYAGSGSRSADTYGEGIGGLRLAGQYRGWTVLEAWWDKSTRMWEQIGLGMDVDAIERGLQEAERMAAEQAGLVSEPGPSLNETDGRVQGLGFAGMRIDGSAAQVEIPGRSPLLQGCLTSVVGGSPQSEPLPGPPTPTPGPDDALLPPASPPHDQPSTAPASTREYDQEISDTRGPASPSPIRLITPYSPAIPQAEAPDGLRRGKDSGFLSPPSTSPPRSRRKEREHHPAPAPSQLDLPTRADVQAAQAVHRAEQSGLRGGWVMNLDAAPSASIRRFGRSSQDREHPDGNEMVDIDLEGGSRERFGSPKIGDDEWHQHEHALTHVGLEQRRVSSPNISRTPSPLSIETSFDSGDKTPKAMTPGGLGNDTPSMPMNPRTNSGIRKPPPIAIGDDSSSLSRMSSRTKTPDPEHEQEVVRFHPVTTRRMERESSFASMDSNEELLNGNGNTESVDSSPAKVRTSTPPVLELPVAK